MGGQMFDRQQAQRIADGGLEGEPSDPGNMAETGWSRIV